MEPQEIKERYRQLLEEYHSKNIDWKTFEMRLLELKLMRSQLASNQDGSGPQTERSFFNPAPPSEPQTGTQPGGTGRFQLDDFPGESTRTHRPADGIPLIPRSFENSSIVSTSQTGAHGSASRIIRATGPLQTPRRGQRLNIGVKLGKDYRLQRFLGVGQCGETWLAEELGTGNFVVVKTIPQPLQNDENALNDFQKAFRKVRSLHFPGICPLFRLAKDDILGFFTVSGFVDAITIDEYYTRYHRSFHGFPIAAIVRLLWPVAKALDYAHRRGVVHQSLNPNNVLVGKHCGVVVTDFWIPTTVRKELQRLGISIDAEDGASWRAPEVWMEERTSPRSDQYSLGVLAYQLVFGRRPFRGSSEEELRENILLEEPPGMEKLPRGLGIALRKVLSKSPEDRYASCLDFVAQLDNQGSQGAHFAKSTEEENIEPTPRRGLWTLPFFGVALKEPESISKATIQDLWPFENLETPLEPKDADRQSTATFPYRTPPKGFPKPGFTQMLTSLPGILGVSACSVILAGALFFGLSGTSDKFEPKSTKDVTDAKSPVENVKQRASTPESHSLAGFGDGPSSASAAMPSIHKILEDNAETVDPSEVNRLTTLAAGGDVDAQRKLGEAYFYGKGVSRDRKRAIEYFQLGAEQEDVSSLYHLGRCYELGIGGIHKSMVRAAELYKAAAEGGSEASEEALKRLKIKD